MEGLYNIEMIQKPVKLLGCVLRGGGTGGDVGSQVLHKLQFMEV